MTSARMADLGLGEGGREGGERRRRSGQKKPVVHYSVSSIDSLIYHIDWEMERASL